MSLNLFINLEIALLSVPESDILKNYQICCHQYKDMSLKISYIIRLF